MSKKKTATANIAVTTPLFTTRQTLIHGSVKMITTTRGKVCYELD